MGRLSNVKKIKLLKIEKDRLILFDYIKNNYITEADILGLINKDVNYGITNINPKKKKETMLKRIFNSPFLLCDQPYLSINIKKLLPYFLDARYQVEKEILKYHLDNNFMNEDEYKIALDELEFVYYKSSEDGKNILKTGHVVDVKSNIIRTR